MTEAEAEWHLALDAAAAEELARGRGPQMREVEVGVAEGRRRVLLVLVAPEGGDAAPEALAIDGRCSHRGGPLEHGDLEDLANGAGLCVRCPWHGRWFSVRTGKEVLGETLVAGREAQRPHEAEWRADGVYVRLPAGPAPGHSAFPSEGFSLARPGEPDCGGDSRKPPRSTLEYLLAREAGRGGASVAPHAIGGARPVADEEGNLGEDGSTAPPAADVAPGDVDEGPPDGGDDGGRGPAPDFIPDEFLF